MPLKQLSKFWRSHEKPWIICKVELKLKWTNHNDLSANGNYNTDGDRNDIIFTIKDTKSYVSVVMFLAKDLKDQCIGMNMPEKMRIKIRQKTIYIFSDQCRC